MDMVHKISIHFDLFALCARSIWHIVTIADRMFRLIFYWCSFRLTAKVGRFEVKTNNRNNNDSYRWLSGLDK